MKWEYRTPGIPDESFIKKDIPMTKSEIRVITLSKAMIQVDSIIYDIGAGAGSITIEAGILAKKGKVYSIEKDRTRAEVIQENIKKFELTNIEVIIGEAPDVLENLPKADRIIIGGSSGKIKEILSKSQQKLDEKGIIIVNAVTPDTMNKTLDFFDQTDFKTDISQISVTRFEENRKNRKKKSLNPVFIIKGSKTH